MIAHEARLYFHSHFLLGVEFDGCGSAPGSGSQRMDLYDAVWWGDLNHVRQLLAAGRDVSWANGVSASFVIRIIVVPQSTLDGC